MRHHINRIITDIATQIICKNDKWQAGILLGIHEALWCRRLFVIMLSKGKSYIKLWKVNYISTCYVLYKTRPIHWTLTKGFYFDSTIHHLSLTGVSNSPLHLNTYSDCACYTFHCTVVRRLYWARGNRKNICCQKIFGNSFSFQATEMVLTSKWGKIQPEIQIKLWPRVEGEFEAPGSEKRCSQSWDHLWHPCGPQCIAILWKSVGQGRQGQGSTLRLIWQICDEKCY